MRVPITSVVLIAIAFLLLPSLYENVLSQGQFLTYKNPDYDISIRYPNDWTISEDNLLPHQVVIFSAPEVEEEESSVSTVIYIPADLVIAVQPLYSPDMTIDQFIEFFLNETYSNPTEYRIIESSNVTLAGMKDARKIVMYEYVGDMTSKVMRTIGIENGTAYMIKYLAEPGQFSSYLPIAQNMIDSFQPSLQQSSNNPQVRQGSALLETTDSQNITQIPEQSEVSQQNQQQDILLEPEIASNRNEPQIPQTLIVEDSILGDSRLPLRYSITDGIATKAVSSGSTEGELNDWYPIVAFQFNEPSGIGLVNLKHVIVGPIKSYESPGKVLEDSRYWQNVPLNEQVVLEMDQPGLNYLIAAVQFTNGTQGVYSAIMDVDATGTKSAGEDYLDFQIDEGEDYNILDDSEIEDIRSDPGFQRAISDVICSDLDNYGFQVCREEPTVDSSANGEQLPDNDDVSQLFDDESQENDEDDDDDENGDDDEDD